MTISKRFVEGFNPYKMAKIRRNPIKTKRITTYKPSPARALNTGGGGVELLFQVIETAESVNDRIFQRAVLESAPIALALRCSRSQVLPEQGMVDMA